MAHQILSKEFRRMQKLAGLLKEEFDFDLNLELDSFFKNNPIDEENKLYVDVLAKKHIESKIGRSLTPQEKSKITKIANQYQLQYSEERFEKQDKEKQEEIKYRYQNNLLPLFIDNSSGTPDSKYYKLANTYHYTDMDGKVHKYNQDPKSGYTDYKLRDEWINTPVPKEILDKYLDKYMRRG
jgi:hypothetical protein